MEHHKTIQDHSERAHALLSASGASIWTKCLPSARLQEFFPDETTEFAEEGTLAHELAEIFLKADLDLIDGSEAMERHTMLQDNPLYNEDMDEHVMLHVNYVKQQYAEAKRITPDAEILIEEKVDLTHLIEDSFGTCDDIIIRDGVLEVIDLKYGLGVRVEAENNKQLMLYGSGALEAFSILYRIDTVRLTIVQPRLDSISSWEISASDLRKWGEEVLKPIAELAFEGSGELVTGEHCQFCKAAPRCRARAEEAKALAAFNLQDPRLLNDDELLKIFELSGSVGTWAKKVDNYMFAEAMAGRKWEGYKLVEGQNRRSWGDQEKAIQTLQLLEHPLDKILAPRKIKGIGDIETLVGKKEFTTILGSAVVERRTSPSLVPESDKRKEMKSAEDRAKDAFADEDLT